MFTPTRHLCSIIDHDGAVILDISRNSMIALNQTGAYIWQRLREGMDLDTITTMLARETNTDEISVSTDVAAFLEELKSRHLVTIAERAERP